ncbi:MAG: hypothetical protein PHW22_03850 [Bacilli bacterium]|nr:hypothetical protein [Bacilli bacterium]
MTWKKSKYYFRGTGVIILVLALVLLSCYGIASSSNDLVRTIFYIVFSSISAGIIIAYWIYAFLRENRLLKEEQREKELGKTHAIYQEKKKK